MMNNLKWFIQLIEHWAMRFRKLPKDVELAKQVAKESNPEKVYTHTKDCWAKCYPNIYEKVDYK